MSCISSFETIDAVMPKILIVFCNKNTLFISCKAYHINGARILNSPRIYIHGFFLSNCWLEDEIKLLLFFGISFKRLLFT